MSMKYSYITAKEFEDAFLSWTDMNRGLESMDSLLSAECAKQNYVHVTIITKNFLRTA